MVIFFIYNTYLLFICVIIMMVKHMELSVEEKFKRVEIAEDLYRYSEIIAHMLKERDKSIKEILAQKSIDLFGEEITEDTFERIKKHHFLATVLYAFSCVEDEYVGKLDLKSIGLDTNKLKIIFVNQDDINDFINPMTGKVKDAEIIKYIRNALNHHENCILYKYIEDEDSIEVQLNNLGKSHTGRTLKLHVKIPLEFLMSIIMDIDDNENQKSLKLYMNDDVNSRAIDLRQELRNKIKLVRVVPIKGKYTKEMFAVVSKLSDDERCEYICNLERDGLVKLNVYTYDSGGITDDQIDSIYYQIISRKDDLRENSVRILANELNGFFDDDGILDESKGSIGGHLALGNMLPFSSISFNRIFNTLMFNNECLKNWNDSYHIILKRCMNPIHDLYLLNRFEWFMLDPVERYFSEVENFIAYSVINFAPVSEEEQKNIYFNGRRFNCEFLRNAFAHGRVAIVRKANQYMIALYDTRNGLRNEGKYLQTEDFKPQLYYLKELVEFAKYLCVLEKKKINNSINVEKNNELNDNEKNIVFGSRR